MRTFIVALAAGLLAASGVAFAETRSERVYSLDVNTNTQTGAAELHKRIVRTARDVCMVNERLTMTVYRARMACVRDTVDATIEKSQNAGLRAFHAQLAPRNRYTGQG
jgi:UrcA family protein